MENSQIIGCVVDQHPRFRVEVVLWALCVHRFVPIETAKPVVWFVGHAPDDLDQWIKSKGIETRTTAPLIEASPHCYKIIPFLDVT